VVNVKAGSQVYQLLQLLAYAGELPTSCLAMIGNERVWKEKLIHRLESVQDVRCSTSGEIYQTSLVTVSGIRGKRTIRLSRGALSVLREMDTHAHQYYMDAFGRHNFSGDIRHIDRNHRVAEGLALCHGAEITYQPHMLPELSKTKKIRELPASPRFYIARDIKQLGDEELNKTSYTRYIGALFYPGGGYIMYNTRNASMKWSISGELKMVELLDEIARMSAGLDNIRSALLLGSDAGTALQSILDSALNRNKACRMDHTFPQTHFVPLNADGPRLLKILTLPDWNEKLLTALFNNSQRRQGFGNFEYDAVAGERFVYSHLDSDLARLIRLKEAVKDDLHQIEVLGYPWQLQFLREYLGPSVVLTPIEMNDVEAALHLEVVFVSS